MLQFVIVNMSCGHCQLKISAALKEHGFFIESLNMDNGEVIVRANEDDKHKIVHLLDQIGYMVDQSSLMFLRSHTLSSIKFEDDSLFDEAVVYLTEHGYLIEDVLEDMSLVIRCSERDLDQLKTYVASL